MIRRMNSGVRYAVQPLTFHAVQPLSFNPGFIFLVIENERTPLMMRLAAVSMEPPLIRAAAVHWLGSKPSTASCSTRACTLNLCSRVVHDSHGLAQIASSQCPVAESCKDLDYRGGSGK